MLLQYKDEQKKKTIPILVKLLKVDHKEKDYYNYTNSHIDLTINCSTYQFQYNLSKTSFESQSS
jgi:hypothetical protein